MAERPLGFARRMMAQQLMTDALGNEFSDSPFFAGKVRPSVRDIEQPNFAEGLGDAMLGRNKVDSFMFLPIGTTPEGNVVPAVPGMVQGAAKGLVDAYQTGKKVLQGDPRFNPQFGPLPQSAADELANVGMSTAGMGLTGANLLRQSIPEGAIGIFAGKSAATFPRKGENLQARQQVIEEQQKLIKEYDGVNFELTKGRMSLGDERTEELAARKRALMDQMDANTSKVGELQKQADAELEAKFAGTDERTIFRMTQDDEGKGGLFKMPDNQFRFEIDDRPATVKLDIDDDADALFSEITGDALERALPRTEAGVTKPLADFLDHPELFKAYPQLKSYPVKIKFDTNDASRGSFNPRTKQITINLADMRPIMGGISTKGRALKRNIKSTLVHEIQHAVQEIEGFARGSNPNVSNADVAVVQAVRSKKKIIANNQVGYNTYNTARADLVNLGGAERIKYYEQKSLLDSHQPRLLFNQANWYKYGDDIRREIREELGIEYNKRKSPKRELWISTAFAKLAQKERDAMPASARLADTLSMKEIKSQYGKASRLADKNYEAFAQFRNARSSLDQIEASGRYSGNNPNKQMNIYLDSLGEVEARGVQARAFGPEKYGFTRSYFPPDQFIDQMDTPPPFGLENTLRQQGGFFKD